MHAHDDNAISPVRWLYSFGRKLLHIVPWLTVVIVATTIVSQLSMFAAFFLPLKAVILIGSPAVPGYFPAAAHSWGRESLIILLSVASAAFYAIYLAAEHIIARCTERGSQKLLSSSSKIVLFAGQDDVANRAYQRYARSLAGLAFVVLAVLALSFLDWKVSLFIVIYWLVIWAVVRLADRWLGWKVRSVTGFSSISSSIGFLMVFGFIVTEAMLAIAPNLFIAILGLLFSRQVMQRIAGVIQDVAGLYAQRLQVNALFFHGHSLVEDSSRQPKSFWNMLEPATRSVWINKVLQEVQGGDYVRVESLWHQSGVHDVAAFEVQAFTADSSCERFLLKLFNGNRQALALNEATVLGACPSKAIGALEFLGADSVEGLHCHVFRWGDFHKMDVMDIKPIVFDVSRRLMEYQPPDELVQRYVHSRSQIWERLNGECLEQFHNSTKGSPLLPSFQAFEAALPHICALLRQLPLQLVNPEFGVDSILVDPQGSVAVSYWGKWALEPVGFGWFATPKEVAQLADIHAQLLRTRSDYSQVSLEQLRLCALMAAVDRFFARQSFLSVIDLLPDILNTLHQLGSPERAMGEITCPA